MRFYRVLIVRLGAALVGFCAAPAFAQVIVEHTAPAAQASRNADKSFASDFAHLIDRMRGRFPEVPSIAWTVTRSDQVLSQGTRGWVDVEKRIPVDKDTPYYIASSGKSFVALSLEALARRGLINLDWTLQELAPDIAFDPAAKADKITLRHLLSHTHGLDIDPIESRWAYIGIPDSEIQWRIISKIRPSKEYPLGSYNYSNTGYNIAASLIERRFGKRWQGIVQNEVLNPLRLNQTIVQNIENLPAGVSIPVPYSTTTDGSPKTFSLRKDNSIMHSAGSMFAPMNDLGRWVQFQLAAARGERKDELAMAASDTLRPYAKVSTEFGPFKRDHYGLGWYSGPYRDRMLYHSFGGFPGNRSHVSFVPELNLGVAVETNDSGHGDALVDIAAAYAYDWFAAGSRTAELDAQRRLDDLAARIEKRATRRREAVVSPPSAWQLSLPRGRYAGSYCSPDYGTMFISAEETGTFHVALGKLRADARAGGAVNSAEVELLPMKPSTLRFDVTNEVVSGAEVMGWQFTRCTH